MSMYIIFFGKSQDFTTRYYDRSGSVEDFNTVIKDFDLLESKIFTVDDVKNKEILSRYFFTAQGRKFCLLKLYSFAQAFSGNRIAGSIFGVGLLSEKAINFSKENLALLRAAKDNFAKLSLDGLKFNKSNFQDDTQRIWNAIVTSNDGNLLDKVNTSDLKINGSDGPFAFHVKDLFADAIKLNERVSSQDTVYFSEDLDHLKRTQNKWGKDHFPVYWEQNNQFVPYKEPEVQAPPVKIPEKLREVPQKAEEKKDDDPAKLKADLSDSKYENKMLEQKVENLLSKKKLQTKIILGLSGLLLLSILYFFLFPDRKENQNPEGEVTKDTVFVEKNNGLQSLITDEKKLNDGLELLSAVKFIYSYDSKSQLKDSIQFHSQYKKIENLAARYKIEISQVKKAYQSKCKEMLSAKSPGPAAVSVSEPKKKKDSATDSKTRKNP